MSNEPTLYRATTDLEVKGRTLEGLAIPWDTWAIVQDLRGPTYPEAHARSNFAESLRRDPGPRPLYSTHDYAFDPTADPIGVSHFVQASDALMFRAFLSKTRKADEQLELVKDGAKRAVSVGFKPVKSRPVQRPEGLGKLRVESKLRELSVAPTGFGQYPEARILAMRSEQTYSERTQLVLDACQVQAFGDTPPDDAWAYIRDITDEWAVYEVHGIGVDESERGMFKVEYELSDDGEVTLSERQPVTVSYDYVEDTAERSHLLAPAKDQLLRMRAGRPLLRPKHDPPQ